MTRWSGQASRLPLSDGQWRYSRRPSRDDPTQGWKLHVSATVRSAAEILARVYPVLKERGALFKIPATLDQLWALNSGLPAYSQVGKFLTVYPRSSRDAVELAGELHCLTNGMAGPVVPFDMPYRAPGLVHYRYGVFRSTRRRPEGFLRAPDGRLHRDERAPGKAVPDWLDDPFPRAPTRSRERRDPLRTEYFVYRARTQRGKGGVYEALDLTVSPARRVIIKEGRRHGEADDEGVDGCARVRLEARVLRAMRRAGVSVAEVFREFAQNGNHYLVLELLPGRPLISKTRLHPTKHSWRRALNLLNRLEPLVREMHRVGWVWRDCKPSHVLVVHGQYFFLDFELACRPDDRRVSRWASRHYYPPEVRKRSQRLRGTREDDHALGVIAFQFLAREFPPLMTRKRREIYARTDCPAFLQQRIEHLLAP